MPRDAARPLRARGGGGAPPPLLHVGASGRDEARRHGYGRRLRPHGAARHQAHGGADAAAAVSALLGGGGGKMRGINWDSLTMHFHGFFKFYFVLDIIICVIKEEG